LRFSAAEEMDEDRPKQTATKTVIGCRASHEQ